MNLNTLITKVEKRMFPETGSIQDLRERILRVMTIVLGAVAVVFTGMWTDPTEGGGKRVDVGDDPPCLLVGFRAAQTGLLPLGDRSDPAPDVSAVGAAALAGSGLLHLLRTIRRRDALSRSAVLEARLVLHCAVPR